MIRRMHRKLTITLEEDVYEGLHRVVGRGRISQFIEDVVRPHVTRPDLEESYRQLALEEESQADALEWTEGLIGDVGAALD